MRLPPQIGKTYGRLTVVSKTSTAGYTYTCRCACGKTAVVWAYHLLNGNTKSCGCLKKHPKGAAALTALFGRYVYDAKRRNLLFTLTAAEFKALVFKSCHFCGAPPACKTTYNTNGNIVYNGVDRLDPKKGYIADNVVACCLTCNRMKGKRSALAFIEWARRVFKFNYGPEEQRCQEHEQHGQGR